MSVDNKSRVLFYPFHLCHEHTLRRLLAEYHTVHFMEYMAIQLTEMSGLTAFPDRMGDAFPELIASGRIVQGYPFRGPLDDVISANIDRDLCDRSWRVAFHESLRDNRRFQRGLFDLAHGFVIGGSLVPGPAAFLRLTEERRLHSPASVANLRQLSRSRPKGETAYEFEYAFALVKTAAALARTADICLTHGLTAVTDSEAHYRLLEVTMRREALPIQHRHLLREGY